MAGRFFGIISTVVIGHLRINSFESSKRMPNFCRHARTEMSSIMRFCHSQPATKREVTRSTGWWRISGRSTFENGRRISSDMGLFIWTLTIFICT